MFKANPPARESRPPRAGPRAAADGDGGFLVGLLVAYLFFLALLAAGCADVLLIHPSTDPIATPGASRLRFPGPGGTTIEAYARRPDLLAAATVPPVVGGGGSATATTAGGVTHPATAPPAAAGAGEPSAFLLIFDGNAGRAERAVFWGDQATGGRAVEVWSANYPGFGGSTGRARLATIGPAALAAYDALRARAGGRPVVVWGASLGTTAALHVAAHRPVAAMILTNPPPLRPLLLGRYGWWNLWLVAGPVAAGLPADLDSVANAARATGPALFVSADDDGLVPPAYQQRVIDAYAGVKRVVRLPNAGHNTPAAKAAPAAWGQGVDWIWQQVGR